jgi:hypothetical protein
LQKVVVTGISHRLLLNPHADPVECRHIPGELKVPSSEIPDERDPRQFLPWGSINNGE